MLLRPYVLLIGNWIQQKTYRASEEERGKILNTFSNQKCKSHIKAKRKLERALPKLVTLIKIEIYIICIVQADSEVIG